MVSFTALNNSQHFINLKKEENAIEANGLKVYLKINNLETSRLGINISSKGTNAVNRNKFKRRIKEAVRGLKIEINVDIYVIGSNQSSDISLKDITEILISHPKLKTKWKFLQFYTHQLDQFSISLVLAKVIAYMFQLVAK